MKTTTRREFLVSATAAAAVGSLAGKLAPIARSAEPGETASLPPHRALALTGLHLYTDRPSYRAGESVTAFASTSVPCRLEMVRLGEGLDGPTGDEVLHEFLIDQPRPQPIHPGSYVEIERRLPEVPCKALTLECWVRLWNLHEPQAVFSQLDDSDGIGLIVLPDGSIVFYTGESERPESSPHRSATKLTLPGAPTFSGYVTPPASWHHVVAVFDDRRKELWIDGLRVGVWEWSRLPVPGPCPLRLGALGRQGRADGFLDADIAMPVVQARAVGEIEIRTRHAERGLVAPPSSPTLLGYWPLDEERGSRVRDGSGSGRTGKIINHATWMIGGPSFLPAVPRYQSDYQPARDTRRGHGLRLASDDLVDCHWRPTFSFDLPPTARAGLYVLRGHFALDGDARTTQASFVVRQSKTKPRPPVALLFATNTWKAYSAAPFGPAWPGPAINFGLRGFKPIRDDPAAAYSFYRFHRAGQPAYHLGWRLPWPAASPYLIYSPPEVGYSHLARADRFVQRWLEQEGYPYDALSDLDLHQDERALDGVKVLVIAGHSEYWSLDAMQRVHAFLDRGGRVVSLSGNTMYWRVTHSDDGAVLECRKADGGGAQLADYMRGECWHADDQRRGGALRDCGAPAWQTLGVEFAAVQRVTATGRGAFEAIDAAHPFFHSPVATGVRPGDTFGFDPRQPSRHPLWHESDIRISTLMDLTRRLSPLPGMPELSADAAGLQLLAIGRVGTGEPRARFRDYAHRVIASGAVRPEDSLCDVIHWRRAEGGEVFAAPSISAGWTLAVCPRWSRLLKNVLHHFGVPSSR